jgi:hypothetical protein
LAAQLLQCERALLRRDAVAAAQWAKQLQLGMFSHGLVLLDRGVAMSLMELLNLRVTSRTSCPLMPGPTYIKALDDFHASVEMFSDAKVWSCSRVRQGVIFNRCAATQLRLWPWVKGL